MIKKCNAVKLECQNGFSYIADLKNDHSLLAPVTLLAWAKLFMAFDKDCDETNDGFNMYYREPESRMWRPLGEEVDLYA